MKKFFIIFEIVMTGALLFSLYELNVNNKKLYEFSEKRFKMIQAADRLRHSSDDLTNFARAYVVTGNPEYKKRYFETLDIRNGKLPRPYMYQAIYWDLTDKDRLRKHPPTKKLSLDDIFKSLPYTQKELDLLKKSHHNSDDLVNLEVEAFHDMQVGKQKEAIKIMWSKEYYQAKAKIMNPIDDFMISLDKRTKKEVDRIHKLTQFYFNLFVIISTIFVLGNIYIFFYLRKESQKELEYKNKLNEELEKQQEQLKEFNEKLEEKVKERTEELEKISLDLTNLLGHVKDSINYASFIQEAILPKENVFNEAFDDYFVLWQPRDVVGGDIYQFIKVNDDEYVLMVIDCTGHGVPGAFITMLVKAITDQVVVKLKNGTLKPTPANVLNYFSFSIKQILNQHEYSDAKSNVGFDGGVVYVNKKENILKYAGAETPLFYIEDGKINMIKSDKVSIGYKKSKEEYNFKEIEIEIKSGLKFYITTDGFLDQNGGEKDFPFGKRRFKELIEKYNNLPFSEQKEKFLEEINNWKIDEQNDDITVIGFKF